MKQNNYFLTLGNVLLPFIAWNILPYNFEYILIENVFGESLLTVFRKACILIEIQNFLLEIHTWQIFLAVCSIPPCLLAGISVAFLPESPKFLMSRGKNEKAMNVFKQIYSLNTGKDPNSYPVCYLKCGCDKSQHYLFKKF